MFWTGNPPLLFALFGACCHAWSYALNDKMFPRPIRLKFASGRERVVRSAWEGLECLDEWPSNGDRKYRAALRSCRDALDGWTPPEKAMRAMIDAAREAHLLGPDHKV
jgi:hypothetical protein